MILRLWLALHPLSKLLAIQDHAQNLEEHLWIGGRREVSILSHRPVTSSALKHERFFFRECLNIFATGWSEGLSYREWTVYFHQNLNLINSIVEIEQVQSHKLLGVIIGTQLNFNEHIDNLCKKLTQRIAVLKKIRRHLPLDQRILYYNAMINKPWCMALVCGFLHLLII